MWSGLPLEGLSATPRNAGTPSLQIQSRPFHSLLHPPSGTLRGSLTKQADKLTEISAQAKALGPAGGRVLTWSWSHMAVDNKRGEVKGHSALMTTVA